MIVGNGNIASVLQDREDVIFFAAGVSNSNETREDEFQRELILLLDQDKQKHLVYFSSLSIYRNNNPYNYHKRRMEGVVKRHWRYYTIVRVEIIAWGKNPTTIHNVFRSKLQRGEPIQVNPTHRYVLQKEEFLYWLGLIPVGQCNEMNIPGIRYDIIDILKMVKEGKL